MTKEQISKRITEEIQFNDSAPIDALPRIGLKGPEEYNEISKHLQDIVGSCFAKAVSVESLIELVTKAMVEANVSRSYMCLLIASLYAMLSSSESRVRGFEAAIMTMEMMAGGQGGKDGQVS